MCEHVALMCLPTMETTPIQNGLLAHLIKKGIKCLMLLFLRTFYSVGDRAVEAYFDCPSDTVYYNYSLETGA